MTNAADFSSRIQALGYSIDGVRLTVGSTEARRADFDALRADFREKHPNASGAQETEVLCKWQLDNYGRKFRSLSLGSNIYGLAVQDYMGSNIRGGRSSVTARGASLARCLEVLLENAEKFATGWESFTVRLDWFEYNEADRGLIGDILATLSHAPDADGWGGARCW